MKTIYKIIVVVFILLIVFSFALWRHSLFGSRTSITKLPATSASLNDFYQESQQLSTQNQTAPATATTTFLAVGDIMLSRYVAVAIQKSGDVDYPFLGMADVLHSTDFNFANLEGPVAPEPKDEVIGGSSLVFGDPPQNLTGLKDYNFQIINLANNHAFDQGLAGVDATIKTLNGLGIAHEGTGDSLDEAWTPAVVTSNGIKICFVGASFSSLNDGADIVIGAHPHWAQTVEKYDGKYIFYSLGNFVFDQEFSEDTMQGLALKITLSKIVSPGSVGAGFSRPQSGETGGQAQPLQGPSIPVTLDSIELIPVIIQNAQPRPATPQETKNILNKIGQTQSVLYP